MACDAEVPTAAGALRLVSSACMTSLLKRYGSLVKTNGKARRMDYCAAVKNTKVQVLVQVGAIDWTSLETVLEMKLGEC